MLYHRSERLIPDVQNRDTDNPEAAHIINIDIQDNQEEATIGAFMICDLCTLVSSQADSTNINTCHAKTVCTCIYMV